MGLSGYFCYFSFLFAGFDEVDEEHDSADEGDDGEGEDTDEQCFCGDFVESPVGVDVGCVEGLVEGEDCYQQNSEDNDSKENPAPDIFTSTHTVSPS